MLGIAVGTAALILILSVFNGFESLTKSFLDAYNPDYKIVSKEGKLFTLSAEHFEEISALSSITSYAKVIEEVAHFEYNSRQQIGVIKGVDTNFIKVTDFQDAIKDGSPIFRDDNGTYKAVVGSGLSNVLNISLNSKMESLKVSVPNRKKRGTLDRDFKTRAMRVSGVFSLRNEKDNQYILTDYNLASSLLDLRGQLSAIELSIVPEISSSQVEEELSAIFPEDEFELMDRLEQDSSALKVMNIEKWSSYLIFSFTLILIIFNVIGCLWMIVLEKKKDIAVLQSLGATKKMVRKIFLYEGCMISFLGFTIGFVFSLIFYVLQKTIGIIMVPEGYTISSYPMSLEFFDVSIIFLTVMFLGIVASIPAAKMASDVSAYVRME